MACLHCGRDRPLRCRGLCKRCYYRPGVRDEYPRRWANGSGAKKRKRVRKPSTPTRAPIGSGWKVRVMAARARAGMGVFHPDDNPTAFLMVSEKFWRRMVRRWEKAKATQTQGAKT